MTPEFALWWTIGLVVIAYVLTGGADFGAGIWELFARGKRQQRQRALVEQAIAPIWEANHIWMIVAVVLMFSGFPHAFASIAIALHIPIAMALVGIVLRGSAFTFRAYGLQAKPAQAGWGWVFAGSSALTPFCLGLVIAGLSSGDIKLDGAVVTSGYTAGWTGVFALAVGAFTVVLFALLAAVYLTVEAQRHDPGLANDFRRRALICEVFAGGLAATVAWRATVEAPLLFDGLLRAPWSIPVQLGAASAAAGTIAALYVRRYHLARITAAAQVSLVVIGWGLAMNGHLILPAVPLERAGAQAAVVRPILWTLALGGLVLAPALWALFRVFKTGQTPSSSDQDPPQDGA